MTLIYSTVSLSLACILQNLVGFYFFFQLYRLYSVDDPFLSKSMLDIRPKSILLDIVPSLCCMALVQNLIFYISMLIGHIHGEFYSRVSAEWNLSVAISLCQYVCMSCIISIIACVAAIHSWYSNFREFCILFYSCTFENNSCSKIRDSNYNDLESYLNEFMDSKFNSCIIINNNKKEPMIECLIKAYSELAIALMISLCINTGIEICMVIIQTIYINLITKIESAHSKVMTKIPDITIHRAHNIMHLRTVSDSEDITLSRSSNSSQSIIQNGKNPKLILRDKLIDPKYKTQFLKSKNVTFNKESLGSNPYTFELVNDSLWTRMKRNIRVLPNPKNTNSLGYWNIFEKRYIMKYYDTTPQVIYALNYQPIKSKYSIIEKSLSRVIRMGTPESNSSINESKIDSRKSGVRESVKSFERFHTLLNSKFKRSKQSI